MAKRLVRHMGDDMVHVFGSEDGKHYRQFIQNMDPHIERAKDFAARSDHGKRKSEYIEGLLASVPAAVLHDWLMERKILPWQYARSPELRAEFRRWFMANRDFAKLRMDHYTHRPTGNIVVPVTRPPRRNATVEGEACQTPSKTTET